MNTQLLYQVRQLSPEDQLELVTVLWEDIEKRGGSPALTHAQKDELDRRLAAHEANPEDDIPWSEVKAEALAYIRQ